MRQQREPKWITDAAKSMLQGLKGSSYGDEDQDDLMSEINNGDHDFLPDDDYEPESIKELADSLLKDIATSYGDEDQNDLMEHIRKTPIE